MPNSNPKNEGSPQISRREALGATLIAAATLELGGLGAIAAEAASTPGALPMDPDLAAYLKGPGGKLEYFQDYVGVGSNYRGDKVKPWELSEEKLSAAGLTRETWTLDVISDDGKLLDNPRAKAAGNAITYADVLRLAEQRPLRILKTLVCLGMDPYLLSLPWKDGMVLPSPPAFAASIPGGARNIFGLSGDGTPLEWPIPSFLAYWISPPVRDLKPGRYKAYARAVNRHGDAQPLPRPFDGSGRTALSYCTFRRH